jgi:hypothetical protein
MITIVFQRGGFTQDISNVMVKVQNPIAMLKVCGRELANQLKSHFRLKDRTEPNQLSPRRSHFWLAVSRTVSNPVQEGIDSISVSITHPAFAQKVFGGVIRAKAAGALTIPVEERAYGRTAATFEQETGLKLFLLRIGKGAFQKAVLAAKEGNGLVIEYVLKKSVNQPRDPNALPVASLLEQAILARAQSYYDNEIKLGSSGTGQT